MIGGFIVTTVVGVICIILGTLNTKGNIIPALISPSSRKRGGRASLRQACGRRYDHCRRGSYSYGYIYATCRGNGHLGICYYRYCAYVYRTDIRADYSLSRNEKI